MRGGPLGGPSDNPPASDSDEPVALPLDFEDAMRALLAVDPAAEDDTETGKESRS
jgi:hypothetical protein